MSDLEAWIAEALEPVGTASIRKMFGGAGVYLDGVMFAIVADDELWIKSDAVSDPAFDAAGLPRFIYDFGGGKSGSMNYRRAPSDVYDDAETLRRWARLGLAASERAAARKRRPRPRSP